VVLPEFARLLVLVKEKVVWIFVVFVEVVLATTCFLQGWRNEPLEAGFNFFEVFRFYANVGDDGKFGHNEA